jgi:hypothetical protein
VFRYIKFRFEKVLSCHLDRIATILYVCNLCFYLRYNQATNTLEDIFSGNKAIFQTGKIVSNWPWSFVSVHLKKLIVF